MKNELGWSRSRKALVYIETKSRNLISNAILTFTKWYPNWKERVPENSFLRKGNFVRFRYQNNSC